jgi:nucleoside-diphosphate-sugar epimerase
VKPEIVIHCAACTAHNAEPMAYVMANVVGTVHVVVASRKVGARWYTPQLTTSELDGM